MANLISCCGLVTTLRNIQDTFKPGIPNPGLPTMYGRFFGKDPLEEPSFAAVGFILRVKVTGCKHAASRSESGGQGRKRSFRENIPLQVSFPSRWLHFGGACMSARMAGTNGHKGFPMQSIGVLESWPMMAYRIGVESVDYQLYR